MTPAVLGAPEEGGGLTPGGRTPRTPPMRPEGGGVAPAFTSCGRLWQSLFLVMDPLLRMRMVVLNTLAMESLSRQRLHTTTSCTGGRKICKLVPAILHCTKNKNGKYLPNSAHLRTDKEAMDIYSHAQQMAEAETQAKAEAEAEAEERKLGATVVIHSYCSNNNAS